MTSFTLRGGTLVVTTGDPDCAEHLRGKEPDVCMIRTITEDGIAIDRTWALVEPAVTVGALIRALSKYRDHVPCVLLHRDPAAEHSVVLEWVFEAARTLDERTDAPAKEVTP